MVLFVSMNAAKKNSTYEHAWSAKDMTTSQINKTLKSFISETKELRATNQDMQTYIDRCNKERAAYKEHNNLH